MKPGSDNHAPFGLFRKVAGEIFVPQFFLNEFLVSFKCPRLAEYGLFDIEYEEVNNSACDLLNIK